MDIGSNPDAILVYAPCLAFQLLWNWLVPAIFGLGKITFFQAFGLKLLLALVFGRMSVEDNRKKE